MKRHDSTTTEAVCFSAGALLGAGLALLYAPKTGHELREKVSGAAGDAIAHVKEFGGQAHDKLNSVLTKGQEFAEEKAAEAEEVKERYL